MSCLLSSPRGPLLLLIWNPEYMIWRNLAPVVPTMRKAAFLTALVVAVVFAAGTAFAAPPGKISLKEIQKSKPAVAYDHKAHGEKVKACAP